MRSDPVAGLSLNSAPLDIAGVRILRMALGTSLSLLFSQIVSWDLSFVAPVLTLVILSLPLPALRPKGAIMFVVVMMVCLFGGLLLLPLLLNQRWVGIGLLSLALFYSFYFTAKGGNSVVGTFATVGIGVATAVGTVSIDAAISAAWGVSIGAVAGILFVWVAFAILPDSLAQPISAISGHPPTNSANSGANSGHPPTNSPSPPQPDLHSARRNALRSLVIMMPVMIFFLLSSSSSSYLALLIMVASMAQQAEIDQTRKVAKSLLLSTLIGGIGAIIAWEVLTVWPSLLMYTLLIALAGLIIGTRIFSGAGLHSAGGTWSYGYLTMLVVLAPAVIDGIGGNPAGAAFWSRLMMFIYATIYGVGAVYVFDALWPAPKKLQIEQIEDSHQPG
jgi:uncharacterized membrane protein YccC